MSDNSVAYRELTNEAPAVLRLRIMSSMRWSFLLSFIAAPFGYATSVILARIGPEVLGTYGLLSVYIGVVSCFFYLGGDAVVMKFLPRLPVARRADFLVSYYLVVLAALLPWLCAAAVWPGILRFILGQQAGAGFHFLLIVLSPLYIGYSIIIAMFKAVLNMQWAQMLLRGVSVASFLLYGLLFVIAPGVLRTYYTQIIWIAYLSFTATATLVGLWRVRRLFRQSIEDRRLKFALPRGFWRYALTLQQQSVLSMISGRLDYVLLLNLGGLRVLGKYVAVMTVAETLRIISGYLLDPLLPALTNVLANDDRATASRIFDTTLRLLFVVSAAATLGLIFFITPLIGLMGAEYGTIRHLFILMVAFYGIWAPGSAGGILLTSLGKQQRSVWILLANIGMFVGLLALFYPRWQLLGVILAYGSALMTGGVLLLFFAHFRTGIQFTAQRPYCAFAVVTALAATLAIMRGQSNLVEASLYWLISFGLFLWSAGFRLHECEAFLDGFLPRRARGWESASEPAAVGPPSKTV